MPKTTFFGLEYSQRYYVTAVAYSDSDYGLYYCHCLSRCYFDIAKMADNVVETAHSVWDIKKNDDIWSL